MGGAQSGTNNLGDALWSHERQRQRSQREATRYETQVVSTQDRRKLLKRTRSLAVISEDLSRSDRDNRNYHFEDPALSIPRRPQLIPRAKLIDRNSLKDRLSKSQQHLSEPHDRFHDSRVYHSHSTCDLYSAPPHSYFQEIAPCIRRDSHADPDRLNILNWPRTPRRYKSHQDLDSVSGLVDIVEDNWPLEENRNYDIYTQVKRKRKEHRSLDSILFEDEGELEYFDVLNLLPLSKVRLEIDETDSQHNNNSICEQDSDGLRSANIDIVSGENDDMSIGDSELRRTPRLLHVSEFSEDNQDNSLRFGSNVTDEEKYKSHSIHEEADKPREKSHTDEDDSWKSLVSEPCKSLWETESHRESFRVILKEPDVEENAEKPVRTNNLLEEILEYSDSNTKETPQKESNSNGISDTDKDESEEIEQTEDYKSIWVSDTDDIEDMSRRPQVLKIVDNEVTRRCSRNSNIVEIDIVAQDSVKSKDEDNEAELKNDFKQIITTIEVPDIKVNSKPKIEEPSQESKRPSIESARNFFEAKSLGMESMKNQQNEGRFERIVKETSNIIGKACNAVKGSLGFEARSESSDLGLGSDCGSDTRRRSIDDGDDADANDDLVTHETEEKSIKENTNDDDDHYLKPNKTNLTRSHSCVDSIECQETDGPEFDHIRYKIVKSRLFGKNIFSNAPSKGDPGYDGLMQYLREYSFQELLLDNNVVIIEPVRAEPIETKNSMQNNKSKSATLCRANSSVQKKVKNVDDQRDVRTENETTKSPKQSSLRKHFFYHPIRVNKELIDEELPDPDTVKNVRRMFEATLRPKNSSDSNDCKDRKSVSMKDLRRIEERQLDDISEGSFEASRFRLSTRAKDLTRLFEGLDKTSSTTTSNTKEDLASQKGDSKTRILAQSFEARSGNTSPSDSEFTRNKISSYQQRNHRQRQQSSWDAGSVSSGVSSDYPDTDPGSGVQCMSSEDEEIDCRIEESEQSDHIEGHFVAQDVLERIRECGTSVTYYGGKVVNTRNGPLISPMSTKLKRNERLLGRDDYVKFRLVKSNSCDSRLELTGRVVERRSKIEAREHLANNEMNRKPDLRACTIAETPSIEITDLESLRSDDNKHQSKDKNISKREPPVVIGLEPKKDDNRNQNGFKANFQLGKIDTTKSNISHGFGSALSRWQINEGNWNKKQTEFGKMEFEEFEVLEDSLNGINN